MDFKIIKQKNFSFTDKTTQEEVQAVHYTVSHKGRSLNVSSLRFGDNELTPSADGKSLTIKGELELKKDSVADQLTGEVREFLSIYPKMDIAFGL